MYGIFMPNYEIVDAEGLRMVKVASQILAAMEFAQVAPEACVLATLGGASNPGGTGSRQRASHKPLAPILFGLLLIRQHASLCISPEEVRGEVHVE
jgi:hypothetical protein